jgi:hypothetical protein
MEEQFIKETQPLSASKIKKFEDCSWAYWCSYVLKLPDPSNLGAKRGTICHLIFEMLLNPRHLSNYKRIIKAKSIDGDKACARLVQKHMKKEQITDPADYLMIDQMILVGLKKDFFIEGGELLGAEYSFDIKNEFPKYHIRGLIDKPFKVGERVVISDFKSSKKKYEGEEIESNLQGMIYSLASRTLWPNLDPEVQFCFLRFPEDPIVKVKFNENTLKGLEHYLAHVQDKIDNFTEEDAHKNFALNQKDVEGFRGKLMCGFANKPGELKKDGTPKYVCPYKFPFKYFVLKDKDGKTLKSSKTNDFKLKEGEKVIELEYNGCPAHRPPINDF